MRSSITRSRSCRSTRNLIRGRLVGLGRGWGAGAGPLALLACPPGELHDLGLVAFGVTLRQRGWRVALLGADTPLPSLAEAAGSLAPELVVLAAVERGRFERVASELREIGERHALLLAGAGATQELAERAGARLLPGDPVEAAEWVALAAGRAPGR
jgi:methanogenic corrinoid protein MtbC1